MNAPAATPAVGAGDAWLGLAAAAGRFIDSQRTADGACWRRSPQAAPGGAADHSFYYGTAGIVLFLIELAEATGDPAPLARAIAAGAAMDRALRAATTLPASLMGGWAGYLSVFHMLAAASGDDRFNAAARACYDRILAQATALGQGIGWIEPIPYADITGITGQREITDLSIGAAGTLLALLCAHRAAIADDALAQARRAADRLIELAERTGEGLRWSMMADMPFPFAAPNFAHGSAGVAFAMAEMARATGESRYLDAARDGMAYALSHAVRCPGGGALICHVEAPAPPLFYLGVCHGPAGSGRTLVLLDELDGDRRWRNALDDLIAGLVESGAPERRGPGLWRNHGQCCGDAGLGDFALLLAQRGVWDDGLAFAGRCAATIAAHAVASDPGQAWDQAEHRAQPDLIERQTGYMQGAAGIASFLVHFGSLLNQRPVALRPLDWPRASHGAP